VPQDGPQEFEPVIRLTRGQEDEEPGRRSLANIVVLVATAVLVILAYWVFDALDHSRRFQQCLDSGRRNCVGFASANK
jgi:hypothetical protein